MNTTTKALSLTLLFTVACFDSDEQPSNHEPTSTEGSDTGDALDTGGETDAGSPDLPKDGHDPELTSLLVNGDDAPQPVLAAADLDVLANVADPSTVEFINFYLDGEELATSAEAPFATTIRFNSSTQNGVHELRAVAHGFNGGEDQQTLSLTVDLPQRGTQIWIHHDETVPSLRNVFPREDGSSRVLSDPRVIEFSDEGEVLDSWNSELLDGFSIATRAPEQGVLAVVKPPNADYSVVRHFDDDLALQWTAMIGPLVNQDSVLVFGLSVSDGRLILAGARKPTNASWHCPWVVRTTSLSPTLGFDWSSALGCTGELHPEWIGAMVLAPDGTVFVVHEGLPVPKLVHLSEAGEFLWSTTLEGQGSTRAMAVDPDGNLYIAGGQAGFEAGRLVSFDEDGAQRWSTITDTEVLTAVSFDLDGRRLIAVAPENDPDTPALARVVESMPSGLPRADYELVGEPGLAFPASRLVIDDLGYIYVAGALADKKGGWITKLHP